jgi:undecaprenyl-diphosphatase
VLFGIIEGVTEFLPVSSTAHLRLAKALPFIRIPLDDPYWKMFDVVIQLGAVLCLPIYFPQEDLGVHPHLPPARAAAMARAR